MPSPWKVSPSPSFSARISSVNCRSMDDSSQEKNEAIKKAWILNDLCPIERRAEHRGVRVLAAQAAADAAVDDGGDRVAAQRVGVVLHGERGAARKPDAGVVAGTGVLVDAVLDAHVPFTFLQLVGNDRAQLALPFELALALGDDDLEPLVVGAHRFLEHLG